jgi:ZIP family zinc transporter
MTTLVLATRRLLAAETANWRRGAQFAALAATAVLAAAALQTNALRAPAVSAALSATLLTALATGLGALPALFIRSLSDKTRDALLGLGAGVMLAASLFSLLLPALEAGAAQAGSAAAGGIIVAAGITLGALFLFAADRLLPHEHTVKGHEGPGTHGLSRAWLFVFAITLHNLPEGLAVGVAHADGSAGANALTLGIALQNMPEGLVVAVALLAIGLAPLKAFAVALLSAMAEPLGGIVGAGMVTLAHGLLPWGLAFAAGAMLFVISHEIIPETHRNGNERVATAGLLAGFVVMMLSDTILA